jgi:hypothetical protein
LHTGKFHARDRTQGWQPGHHSRNDCDRSVGSICMGYFATFMAFFYCEIFLQRVFKVIRSSGLRNFGAIYGFIIFRNGAWCWAHLVVILMSQQLLINRKVFLVNSFSVLMTTKAW